MMWLIVLLFVSFDNCSQCAINESQCRAGAGIEAYAVCKEMYVECCEEYGCEPILDCLECTRNMLNCHNACYRDNAFLWKRCEYQVCEVGSKSPNVKKCLMETWRTIQDCVVDCQTTFNECSMECRP